MRVLRVLFYLYLDTFFVYFSSGVVSKEGYCRLTRQYDDKYCGIVDGQDTTSGLNNFAEPVMALVTGHRNGMKAILCLHLLNDRHACIVFVCRMFWGGRSCLV